MAAALLKDIVASEAVGALAASAALLIWTGSAAAWLEVPAVSRVG